MANPQHAFDLPPTTRRCAVTGRELLPGEEYRAELIANDEAWARKDYAPEAWPGPRPGVQAWWAARLPAPTPGLIVKEDPSRLATLLDELEGSAEPDAMPLRFAAAMALYRRRALKLQGIAMEEGRETLTFLRGRSRTCKVVNPGLDDAALAEWEAAAWARAAA